MAEDLSWLTLTSLDMEHPLMEEASLGHSPRYKDIWLIMRFGIDQYFAKDYGFIMGVNLQMWCIDYM